MSLPAAPKVPPQVAEQAVRWLVELQGGADDERLRQAWQRWRQAAPEHEQAWRHIEAVNQRLAGIGTPLALAAINAPHSPQRRRALKTLLLVLAAGGSAWGLRESGSLQRWSADYATGVGERRRLALADGSRLELNSDTAVDVRFDAGERRLLLLRGEIQLSTGHDPRPLHVYSAEGRLRPVGTRFDVRQFAGRTRVAVHEGAVQVENRAGQGLLLPSGRQLDFDRERLGAPQPLPVGSGAWTDGMLVAAGMRWTNSSPKSRATAPAGWAATRASAACGFPAAIRWTIASGFSPPCRRCCPWRYGASPATGSACTRANERKDISAHLSLFPHLA